MTHYDVIIIGTGAGGGTLAYHLAPSGKRILLLERGDYVRREKDNWSSRAVNVEAKYNTKEVWQDKDGKPLHPHTNYYVGGNTKFYGAALFRLREEDFGEIRHHGGVSPAWPISYDEIEPYYTKAEYLYQVHGERGVDPTEPWASAPYRFPAVQHEPRIQQLHDDLTANGLRPFHVPLGIMLDESDPRKSRCIRCETCDGFPCLIHAKSDAQVICVDPALAHPNVTLVTNARVTRLLTSASGREITGVVGPAQRRRGDLLGRYRRVFVRRHQFGGAAAAVGQRSSPQRPGQCVGRRRPTLHGPREFGVARDFEVAQRDRVSEDARRQRLLLRRRRVRVPDGPHLVRRQAGRRCAVRRRARHRAGHDARHHGEALPRLLADVGRSARSRTTASRSTATATSSCRTRRTTTRATSV